MSLTDSTNRQVFTICLTSETDLKGWREGARKALIAGVPPDRLTFTITGRDATLALDPGRPLPEPPANTPSPVRVPRKTFQEINAALLHRRADRFVIAYRLLWRARRDPAVLRNPADADRNTIAKMARNVRRDIHKMHAFVRFRKAGEDAITGREQFVAWFEPDHHIIEATGPFFRNRFTGMDWTIIAPERSSHWDGRTLRFGPGGSKADVPPDDAIEAEWRSYYGSIFNPARVKTKAMKSEMPVKYWKNLPEAEDIATLIGAASGRVQRMVAQPASAVPNPKDETVQGPTPSRDVPASLEALNTALRAANDAPYEGFSERLVFGAGPVGATIMLVGEQPGDVEDQQGQPFVGPAGQLLDRALQDAGVERARCYVTNAVKRFKFVQRGKRRIHQKPSNDDIAWYRWWLHAERQIVGPQITVALGASAARALTGQATTISRVRGQLHDLDGSPLAITVHPSYLLRLPDKGGQQIEYEKFVRDLERVQEALG